MKKKTQNSLIWSIVSFLHTNTEKKEKNNMLILETKWKRLIKG